MGHVHKRLLSSIAVASTAHLPKFPPKILTRETLLQPETWAELQPPPESALSAFANRIGLSSVLTSTELIQQACTHESFVPFYMEHNPGKPKPATNSQLEVIGNSLLGLFATEHLHATYPYLPTRVLKAAVTAQVGPLTCASVAQEMGAVPLLRWRRTRRTTTRPPLLHPDALASIPRAITALVYQKKSLPSARLFAQSHFLSREIDLRGMIKFRDPKTALLEMVQKFNREPPKSRLLKETGRYSNSPVFVVGIFSGEDQLGEGFGSSLKMAEFRAAEDALLRVYITKTPANLIQYPTSTFPLGIGSALQKGPEGKYNPQDLPTADIMYASSGRSWAAPGSGQGSAQDVH